MNVGVLFGKRTWGGLGISVGVFTIEIMLGALLVVRGVLPQNAVSPWLWVSYGLSVFAGGRFAAAGQRGQLCALLPGILLYLLAWLLALCSECLLNFASDGLEITIAVVIGIVLAFIWGNRKKKGKHARKIKRPSVRTVYR